ncbi:MAG TPA: nucleotidyltransferase domain-containing protein [Pyrinomonadaceae bacterium]|jgi:predicted nucleotidyltransferase
MMNQFAGLIDDLRTTHGRNLASVILYGSAAAGDFVKSQSDYNLLIALHEITPKELRNSQAPMREWSRLGHPIPVYFTVNELQTAADVFPIEFHQMERARKVLFGTDVLANIDISDEYLRHQTEYELRSKLILLRRHYIPVSTSVPGLLNLMSESLSSFAALFRAVLLLHGIEPPVDKHKIIALTTQHLNVNGATFEKVFNIRENNYAHPLDDVSANQLFAEYMREIEKVIEAVDNLKTS